MLFITVIVCNMVSLGKYMSKKMGNNPMQLVLTDGQLFDLDYVVPNFYFQLIVLEL